MTERYSFSLTTFRFYLFECIIYTVTIYRSRGLSLFVQNFSTQVMVIIWVTSHSHYTHVNTMSCMKEKLCSMPTYAYRAPVANTPAIDSISVFGFL